LVKKHWVNKKLLPIMPEDFDEEIISNINYTQTGKKQEDGESKATVKNSQISLFDDNLELGSIRNLK
jgi:hypothetical protein